ncbi:hypothetical protein NEDG_01218 [Nematocida displodere]|uniref:Thioredoxin domain-containing protein n=1 Tax=Nematocida displodere TaxID=1805483 RepID=A0A177EDK8_9MICR|nr:hypothetical protein NEDG_01218 [Nematocida displodere]
MQTTYCHNNMPQSDPIQAVATTRDAMNILSRLPNKQLVVIVSSKHCRPCDVYKATLAQFLVDNPNYTPAFSICTVDETTQASAPDFIPKQLSIRQVPTTLIASLSNGQVVWKQVSVGPLDVRGIQQLCGFLGLW